MKQMRTLISFAIFGFLAAASADGTTAPYAMQKVLKQYGLDSEVLRPPEELRPTSSRQDGLFSFSFQGNPGFDVLLDRDYWVIASWSDKRENDAIAYALNPIDEQSALNITVGKGLHERSDAMLSQDPGFTRITRGKGVIADQSIEWRRWSDANHLYSDCTLEVPSGDAKPRYRLNVSITANSAARRAILEGCMKSLRLLPKKTNQTARDNAREMKTSGLES
jgi:hypothetical protein